MIPTRDAKELKTKTTLPKTFKTIKNNKIGHPLVLADLMEIDGVSVGSAEAFASRTSGAGSMGFTESGRLCLKTTFLDAQNKISKGSCIKYSY